MRTLLLLLLISVVGCQSKNSQKHSEIGNFKINIKYSCLIPSCPEVYITQDSLIWKDQSRQEPRIIKTLSQAETREFAGSLQKINLLQMKDDYVNHHIDDGIEFTINASIKNQQKNIQVANYYQPEVDQLIKALNKLLPQGNQLYYPEKMLKKFTEQMKKK